MGFLQNMCCTCRLSAGLVYPKWRYYSGLLKKNWYVKNGCSLLKNLNNSFINNSFILQFARNKSLLSVRMANLKKRNTTEVSRIIHSNNRFRKYEKEKGCTFILIKQKT